MNNKRLLLLITTLILLGVASSCSGPNARGGATPVGTDASSSGLPQQMLLPVGTLMLEESDQAVTAEQADQLLPLWKAARSLTTSDSVAPQEVTAIYKQITGTMSAEQIKAINAFSGKDVNAFAAQMGISTKVAGGGSSTNSARQSSSAGMSGGPGGGGMVGMLSGGGGPPGMGSSNNNTEKTGSSTSKTLLFDLVIDLLKSKL